MTIFDEAYRARFPLFGDIPTRCVVKLTELLPTAAVICDLGCGDGRDTRFLLNHGFSVVAIDISEPAIANLSTWAQQQGHRTYLDAVVADVVTSPLGNARFDAVLGITILDHLEVDARDSLLARALRAVKPGGYIAFESHSDRDPRFRVSGHAPIQASEFAAAIRSHYASNELLKPLMAANWRIIDYSDRMEQDADHGPIHEHGFVTVIAQRQEDSVKDAGIVMELAVETVSKSLTFYRDIVGMDLTEMLPENEQLATWAELAYGGSRLMIQQRLELENELPATAGRAAGAALVVVRVAGRTAAEEIWRRVESSTIEVAQMPRDTDYGTHEFSVLDPDGYIVLVAAGLP